MTRYEAPPPRDRLPTLPEDLSEYAWLNTGPQSWSATEAEAAIAEEEEEEEEEDEEDEVEEEEEARCWIDEVSAGVLVDLWHNDVPRVVRHETALVVDEREAQVVSLMDGEVTIGTLLETSGLPLPDVLGTLCELCARGVVTLDRSRRLSP